MRRYWIPLVLLVFSVPHLAQATASTRRHGIRDEVTFRFQHFITNPGTRSVFVVGDLPELGGGDVRRSVKLVSADAFDWEVTVSLPPDRAFSYQFLERNHQALNLGNAANVTVLSPELTGTTRPTLMGPGTKLIRAHTALREPTLHWRQDDGAYRTKPMRVFGGGRTLLERHCGVRAFGVGGQALEFYLTSGDGAQRDPADPGATYETRLDACFLQDGELFGYVPAPSVSPPRLASTEPFTIPSALLGEERTYQVLLPRGYDEHTGRRYPVLYLYDGQMLWSPHPVHSPAFGTWDPGGNRLADLVRRGLVGEVILVGIEFLETDPDCDIWRRGNDCLSPEDAVPSPCGLIVGGADQFVRFVVEELKPWIDAAYRTLPGREHTFAAGYSFGGVYAMYAGWEFPETFGAIAAQSGSFWVPRFTERLLIEPRREGLRLYLDFGTAEVPSITEPNALLRDSLLSRVPGYVVEGDLRYELGFGQNHTYTNGGRRLARVMTFLWPATSEPAGVTWP